jgi:prepilin-type N-terminal cleavage/methylation domain-containing protein/prepilin-type processing-associated H-X9-DG protein
MRRRNAFTLVELLVVVAVILLLATLLLAALRSARRSADRGHCGSNLRQLGVATLAYLNEPHNRESFWRYYRDVPGGRRWWFGFEPGGPGSGRNRPLDTAQAVPAGLSIDWAADRMLCPSFPYDDGAYFPKFAAPAASYGYNLTLGPASRSRPTASRVKMSAPGSVFVFADGVHFDFGSTFNEGHYITFNPGAAVPSGYAHFRHDGQAQMVMADGHVEAQPLAGKAFREVGGGAAGNLAASDGSSKIYGP